MKQLTFGMIGLLLSAGLVGSASATAAAPANTQIATNDDEPVAKKPSSPATHETDETPATPESTEGRLQWNAGARVGLQKASYSGTTVSGSSASSNYFTFGARVGIGMSMFRLELGWLDTYTSIGTATSVTQFVTLSALATMAGFYAGPAGGFAVQTDTYNSYSSINNSSSATLYGVFGGEAGYDLKFKVGQQSKMSIGPEFNLLVSPQSGQTTLIYTFLAVAKFWSF